MRPIKIISYTGAILAVANINAVVDVFLHPDIAYFDTGHLIVGGVMAVFAILLIGLVEKCKPGGISGELSRFVGISRYGVALGAAWTVVISTSMIWNIIMQKQQTIEIALNEAKTVYEKDFLYYRWATGHHGVFVPVTDKTTPNPYLRHLPEYKITTAAGQALTLVNPEYMIRQVYEMQTKQHGPFGHITSLDPIRPENEADEWETSALEAFESGAEEVNSVEELNGERYLRLMRPLNTEVGCLKCHAPQGYETGDIRGGISVSIPLTPLMAISRKNIATYSIVHGVLWLFGMIGIIFGSFSVSQSIGRMEMAEARTRLVIENMMDGVITLDAQGHIESLNSSASAMFMLAPVDVVGLKIGTLLAGKGGLGDSEFKWDEKALSRAKGSLREFEGKRQDDTTFPLEMSVSEMSFGKERVFIVMVRDVTKRKQAESALVDSQQQIIKQEKLVSLGTMVAGIAHEINNPAQAISFSMEGLKMNIDYVRELIDALQPCIDADPATLCPECSQLKSKVAELRLDLVLRAINDIAERNIESIERIDHIITSTKRMAHSDEEFSTCDVNTIVHDAITLTHNQIKYVMTLEADLAPNLPQVKGLAQELGQVFINMIINARDAIESKGLTRKEAWIKISTSYDAEKKGIAVRFADNGNGISQEIVDKIFDPFFTTKTIGKGMGLGLNLCHRIVEAHGGQILVDSNPGQGTVFTVFLKVVES